MAADALDVAGGDSGIPEEILGVEIRDAGERERQERDESGPVASRSAEVDDTPGAAASPEIATAHRAALCTRNRRM